MWPMKSRGKLNWPITRCFLITNKVRLIIEHYTKIDLLANIDRPVCNWIKCMHGINLDILVCDYGQQQHGLSRNLARSMRHHRWLQQSLFTLSPGRVAQSVGHLTHKSGILGLIPGLATYFRFFFRFFKKGSCQLLVKVCARSTVNRLEGLSLPRKSVVRLTDSPDMTLDVYCGRKTAMQQCNNNNPSCPVFSCPSPSLPTP